jgi:hypothetical protein
MIDDPHWQRELITALHLENAFEAAQLGFAKGEEADLLKPTRADSERAVANIRAWRTYLSEPCVASMIDEGWQWST